MNEIKKFENSPIRSVWDEETEEWYFSVVDVISVLTEQVDYNKSRKYWNKLKQRLSDEGSELVTICHQLKMKSPKDNKNYLTDASNAEGILRIIQSIPSKKAEPFKMWLARVGSERINEIIDPEIAIERAFEDYAKKGYSEDWINQRILTASSSLTLPFVFGRLDKSKNFNHKSKKRINRPMAVARC